jgi:oxygen-independent coproporphyrinogen-3 oxidase
LWSALFFVWDNLLSLYIHIPFCAQKCAYCSFSSFFVNPEIKEQLIGQYLQTLEQEIRHYGNMMWKQQIKSLYLWWGTPNILTPEQLFTIVGWIDEVFDLENIVELSIELNPYPTDEIYDLINKFHTHFKWCPRLRFSFGIQTFDNSILSDVGRPVTFAGLTDFLRWLRELKLENMVFNLDFIAFWKFNQTRKW